MASKIHTRSFGNAYKLFLGSTVAATAGLASFIIVVSIGPLFEQGEAWLGWGFAWWFSLPVILVAGVLSPFAVPWYQRSMGLVPWTLAFIGHALAVAIIGVGLTWALFAIVD